MLCYANDAQPCPGQLYITHTINICVTLKMINWLYHITVSIPDILHGSNLGTLYIITGLSSVEDYISVINDFLWVHFMEESQSLLIVDEIQQTHGHMSVIMCIYCQNMNIAMNRYGRAIYYCIYITAPNLRNRILFHYNEAIWATRRPNSLETRLFRSTYKKALLALCEVSHW